MLTIATAFLRHLLCHSPPLLWSSLRLNYTAQSYGLWPNKNITNLPTFMHNSFIRHTIYRIITLLHSTSFHAFPICPSLSTKIYIKHTRVVLFVVVLINITIESLLGSPRRPLTTTRVPLLSNRYQLLVTYL